MSPPLPGHGDDVDDAVGAVADADRSVGVGIGF
jgi:hypothetical protein